MPERKLSRREIELDRLPAVHPASRSGRRVVPEGVDKDILDWFRRQVDDACGGNYQTVINDALRDVVERRQEALETMLRRVIRDELKPAG